MKQIQYTEDNADIDDELRKALSGNEKFKNKYQGCRCFIIGTGPSIKKQNLSKLKNEYVFTVNNGFNMSNYKALHSNFHIYVDSLYFSDENSDVWERIESMKKIGKDTECFFPYTKSYSFVDKYHLSNFLNINWLEEDLNVGFTGKEIDFRQVTPLTGTVVLTAVLLAVFMGFSEIYLLGCDCTDIQTVINAKTGESDAMIYGINNNQYEIRHLRDEFRRRPMEQFYHMQYIKFKGFRMVRNLCENKNIKLLNCTGGLLDNIERCNYEDLIK